MVFGIMPLAGNLSVQANGEGQYYLKGKYTNHQINFLLMQKENGK